MPSVVSSPPSCSTLQEQIRHLEAENARLRQQDANHSHYLHAKINQLLGVLGTAPLRPEELDDATLFDLDPIGTISEAFSQVLDHLQLTNETLSLARDELATIVHAAPVGILVLDRNKTILSCNPQALPAAISCPEQAIGRVCYELLAHNSAQCDDCVLDRVLASGERQIRLDWKAGERYFDVHASPVFNRAGELLQVVMVYSDVTEHHRDEERLRQTLDIARDARNKVDAVIRSVGDALIVTDLEGRIQRMNQAAEELLGLNFGAVQDLPIDRIITDLRMNEYLRAVHLAEGRVARGEFSFKGWDPRRIRILQGRSALIFRRKGQATGLVMIFHEVTGERELERLKNEFVSATAHELQTPLTAIIGFAELLMDEGLLSPEMAQESLAIIHDKAELLSRLVDDLLDVGRIQTQRPLQLSLESCDINRLLRKVLQSQDVKGGPHTLELQLSAEPVFLPLDSKRISHAVGNLLSNAVKFSPRGGAIRVVGQILSSSYQLEVRDEGIGMTPTQVSRAFEEFYRADGSNTAVGGTGLGLSIAKHIVEAHGGTIRIDSVFGVGTTVVVQLPLPAK